MRCSERRSFDIGEAAPKYVSSITASAWPVTGQMSCCFPTSCLYTLLRRLPTLIVRPGGRRHSLSRRRMTCTATAFIQTPLRVDSLLHIVFHRQQHHLAVLFRPSVRWKLMLSVKVLGLCCMRWKARLSRSGRPIDMQGRRATAIPSQTSRSETASSAPQEHETKRRQGPALSHVLRDKGDQASHLS